MKQAVCDLSPHLQAVNIFKNCHIMILILGINYVTSYSMGFTWARLLYNKKTKTRTKLHYKVHGHMMSTILKMATYTERKRVLVLGGLYPFHLIANMYNIIWMRRIMCYINRTHWWADTSASITKSNDWEHLETAWKWKWSGPEIPNTGPYCRLPHIGHSPSFGDSKFIYKLQLNSRVVSLAIQSA